MFVVCNVASTVAQSNFYSYFYEVTKMSDQNSPSFTVQQTTTTQAATSSDSFEIKQAIKANGVTAITSLLDSLIEMRKDWEQNEFARSNQRLYSILQNCYAVYQQMNGTDTNAKACKTIFNSYCETAGFKFKSSTTLMNKIVRCVFGDCDGDRRRISAYAIALKIAADEKINTEEITAYITEEGGVEQIRRKQANQSSPKISRVDTGKAALDNDVLASIKSAQLDTKFDAAEYNDAVLLLATKELDGSFAVRQLIQNSSVIEKAFASLATDITKAAKSKAPEIQAANDKQMRAAAIQQATAAA
jgi:hypothetical protein